MLNGQVEVLRVAFKYESLKTKPWWFNRISGDQVTKSMRQGRSKWEVVGRQVDRQPRCG